MHAGSMQCRVTISFQNYPCSHVFATKTNRRKVLVMNSKMVKSIQKPMESEEVIKPRQDTPKMLRTVVQVRLLKLHKNWCCLIFCLKYTFNMCIVNTCSVLS